MLFGVEEAELIVDGRGIGPGKWLMFQLNFIIITTTIRECVL